MVYNRFIHNSAKSGKKFTCSKKANIMKIFLKLINLDTYK